MMKKKRPAKAAPVQPDFGFIKIDRRSKYPWATMAVGASFPVTCSKLTTATTMAWRRTKASALSKKNKVFKAGLDKNLAIRIWRNK